MHLYNDDCLKVLKNISDRSIDLVVTDPPYNIKKASWDTWKTVQEYIEFMGSVFLECQRVLKNTGSFYFFHNDFMQIVELQKFINENTEFKFKSFITWDKQNFRAMAWKKTSEANSLRTWFNTCEYVLFYTLQDGTGYSEMQAKATEESRNYLRDEILAAFGEINLKEINKALGTSFNGGGVASHYFNGGHQAQVPTRDHYEKLQKWLGSEYLKKSYEEIRNEYEELRIKFEDLRYTHNLEENHNNIWTSDYVNTGKYHVCEKPLDIIKRIIRTSSKKNDVVLDCFMGSGTTGVACEQLERNFIGCEIDKKYFQIAKNRIENAYKEVDYYNLSLF